MKKSLTLLLIIIFTVLLVGCATNQKQDFGKTIKVGANAIPHAEILNYVKPMLAKENINLNVVEINDYIRPNLAVADKELDANFFQHIPFLMKFNSERNLSLVKICNIHIEPMAIYSNKIKTLEQLPEGAIVSIPNDPTNAGRSLLLLEKAGLIKLRENSGINATKEDIVANPKKLEIKELEAPQLPRSLVDVTLAVINTNYALDAKLHPQKDALYIEDKNSPYVNILVCRQGEETRPELKALAKALNSPEVKKFIKEKYKGAIIPAF